MCRSGWPHGQSVDEAKKSIRRPFAQAKTLEWTFARDLQTFTSVSPFNNQSLRGTVRWCQRPRSNSLNRKATRGTLHVLSKPLFVPDVPRNKGCLFPPPAIASEQNCPRTLADT